MTEIKPRYEFRVWGETLAPLRVGLERLSPLRRTESRETYLVSKVTDGCNAKIRAELMDVKVLVAQSRRLEQWKPILKTGFPLESSVVSEIVLSSLKVAPARVTKSAYQLDEFLDLMAHTDGLVLAAISKTRYQCSVGKCAAEYAQITINDIPRETVAVESTDPDAVLQLVRKLGMTAENTSYVREIKQVIGWPALPNPSSDKTEEIPWVKR